MLSNHLSSLSLNQLIDAWPANPWVFAEVSSAESSPLKAAIVMMVIIATYLVPPLLQMALKETNMELTTYEALSATK